MWRPARPEDDSQILEMCLELYREDPGPKPVPPEQTARTLARFRAEPQRGLACVLELKGKVEGYAFLASFWSNELGGEICTLDEFFVRFGQRGHGHGREFLQQLTAESAFWPGKAVAFDLETTPANQSALAFYASLGFRPAKNTHMRLRP
jgi:GNAT superfamily N-acetyltransferase